MYHIGKTAPALHSRAALEKRIKLNTEHMIEPRNRKTRWLHIRLNEAEYAKIEGLRKSTTAASMSEYCRNVILLKPVIVNHRDESVEKTLEVFIDLKKELNAIGKNYNQAVKRLHTLSDLTEFREWILLHEVHKQNVVDKINEIRTQISQLYHQWL